LGCCWVLTTTLTAHSTHDVLSIVEASLTSRRIVSFKSDFSSKLMRPSAKSSLTCRSCAAVGLSWNANEFEDDVTEASTAPGRRLLPLMLKVPVGLGGSSECFGGGTALELDILERGTTVKKKTGKCSDLNGSRVSHSSLLRCAGPPLLVRWHV